MEATGDTFDWSWPHNTGAGMFGVLVEKITGRKKDAQVKTF